MAKWIRGASMTDQAYAQADGPVPKAGPAIRTGVDRLAHAQTFFGEMKVAPTQSRGRRRADPVSRNVRYGLKSPAKARGIPIEGGNAQMTGTTRSAVSPCKPVKDHSTFGAGVGGPGATHSTPAGRRMSGSGSPNEKRPWGRGRFGGLEGLAKKSRQLRFQQFNRHFHGY
jgi:hypothetical protein